jgi:DNA-binding NarL/FixJ family response regulator
MEQPGPSPDHQKPRVVLADDHPAALAQAARVLSEHAQIAGMVSNGFELLEAAERLEPDIIVLDISMPGLGGFDAARRLKQNDSRSKLVFLTVWEDPDFVREALALGAEAYVVKSRLASDLLHAVSEAMSGRKFISPGLIP